MQNCFRVTIVQQGSIWYTQNMVRLYTLGNKKFYFTMYRCKLFAATTDTYKNFLLHFAWQVTTSTHAVCFLHHCIDSM